MEQSKATAHSVSLKPHRLQLCTGMTLKCQWAPLWVANTLLHATGGRLKPCELQTMFASKPRRSSNVTDRNTCLSLLSFHGNRKSHLLSMDDWLSVEGYLTCRQYCKTQFFVCPHWGDCNQALECQNVCLCLEHKGQWTACMAPEQGSEPAVVAVFSHMTSLMHLTLH